VAVGRAARRRVASRLQTFFFFHFPFFFLFFAFFTFFGFGFGFFAHFGGPGVRRRSRGGGARIGASRRQDTR
jgi:hypothetical protein